MRLKFYRIRVSLNDNLLTNYALSRCRLMELQFKVEFLVETLQKQQRTFYYWMSLLFRWESKLLEEL